MYRVTFMSGTWYAIEIISIKHDVSNIQSFVEDGITVILTDDIEGLQEEMGIEFALVD